MHQFKPQSKKKQNNHNYAANTTHESTKTNSLWNVYKVKKKNCKTSLKVILPLHGIQTSLSQRQSYSNSYSYSQCITRKALSLWFVQEPTQNWLNMLDENSEDQLRILNQKVSIIFKNHQGYYGYSILEQITVVTTIASMART